MPYLMDFYAKFIATYNRNLCTKYTEHQLWLSFHIFGIFVFIICLNYDNMCTIPHNEIRSSQLNNKQLELQNNKKFCAGFWSLMSFIFSDQVKRSNVAFIKSEKRVLNYRNMRNEKNSNVSFLFGPPRRYWTESPAWLQLQTTSTFNKSFQFITQILLSFFVVFFISFRSTEIIHFN